MTENSRPSWDELVQLITELDGSDFDNVAIEYDDVSVRMSRGDLPSESITSPGAAPSATAATPQPSTRAPANAAPAASAAPQEASAPSSSALPATAEGSAVTSPMVGIFYRSPSPGAPPFVSEGDSVQADSTIGIIEVMKLMNPVQAGISGTVSSFAAEDSQAVEFGEDLAYILPEGS